MARGDVRPTKSNYSRGSWGGGGSSSSYYDDEGRGASQDVWEWFEKHYTAAPTLAWLLSLDDKTCYWLLKSSTFRYGLMDIAVWGYKDMDSRARRLVTKTLKPNGVSSWDQFHAHLTAAHDREVAKREKERHEAAEKSNAEWAAYQAQRQAEAAKIARDDYDQVMPNVDLTAGMLSSDLNQAFVSADRMGEQGEWIEEIVDAYNGGAGFGYEDTKPVGTKIQITLSLDLSNSMIYNGVSAVAAAAFRDVGLTLKALKAEHADDLYVGFFTFSQDGWPDSNRGKRVNCLTFNPAYEFGGNVPETHLQEFQPYRPSKLSNVHNIFDGTDTWISPLLAAIQLWESENSDPGAVRLDLVITDAVLEHKQDIRDADMIQERRNGTLTTVMLNFMPEREWLNSTMPKRCYQMKVEADNVQGILRNVISEFVAAHV